MTPTLKILYGPPGTGKTWRAARDAVRLIEPTVSDAEVAAKHQSLVQDGRIIWVTFHPSYSYEDFVEGFRPVVKKVGIAYRPKPGPFRLACMACEGQPSAASFFHVSQNVVSDSGDEFEVVEVAPRAMVLKKTKGKGVGQFVPISFWLVERLVEKGFSHDAHSKSGSSGELTDVAEAVGVTKSTLDGPMAGLRAVRYHLGQKGWPNAVAKKSVVLVIDEINRADLSRVFGELITLLEPDKRLGAAEERQVILPYSQELFGVPDNLHVIGTMNTADRSLTLMDHALRRRFDFEEVSPDPSRCASPYGGVDLQKLLATWNTRITALLSREHRVGHSYFMKSQLEARREKAGFANDQDGELGAVALVLRRNIVPLLLEYFHDDWRKADIVLGRNFGTNSGGLLEPTEFAAVNNAAGDVVDLDDVTDFELPAFWDPESANWDPAKLRAGLV